MHPNPQSSQIPIGVAEGAVAAALALGRVGEALAAIERLPAAARRSVEVQSVESELLLSLQRPREAEALAQRGLRRADPEAAARLRVLRALARWESGGRISRAGLERTCEEAGPRVQAWALEAFARVSRHRLDLGVAEQSLERAWALHDAGGCTEGMVRVLVARAELTRDVGGTKEALALQRRALELSRLTSRLDLRASAYCGLAELLLITGEWREAAAAAGEAHALSLIVGGGSFAARTTRGRALIALARGDFETARLAIDEARSTSPTARPLAEAQLAASDLALAIGDARSATAAAEEAARLARSVADESALRRAWVRKAHALVGRSHNDEALACAVAATRGLPVGAPTRTLGELARGRALLRLGRDAEARQVFAGVLDSSAADVAGERGWRALAELGHALADGCRPEHERIARALRTVEGYGERRLLSYCLGELEARAPGRPAVASGEPIEVSASPAAEAVVHAVELLAAEGSWPERCSRVLHALRPRVGWDLAAWLGDPAWQLLAAGDEVGELPRDGIARALASPGRHDLLANPQLRRHPERVLLGLVEAFTAEGDAGPLVLARGSQSSEWSPSQLGIAQQVARILACADARVEARATAPRRAVALDLIVGECEEIELLKERLRRVAVTPVTVRIIGETGTGKELAARAVHELSSRASEPFVAFNAAAVQDELFESELFGHVRGAFTGAVADRAGRVQLADGGTLFIDEVAELSTRAQAKLLRFLEGLEYNRVGEAHVRRADVRIVVATNADLEALVSAGRFREDLLHRMSDPELRLPPLRERGGDLLRLARHFLSECCGPGIRSRRLQPEVVALLESYPWPGNVRELRSVLVSAVALAGPEPLAPRHFPRRLRESSEPLATRKQERLAREGELVRRALAEAGGNCTRAAAALGVSRQWFYAMRRRAGLVEPSGRA